MAPEQLEGREADARSDLWALGCVLYEMSTGARPFDGKTSVSVMAAILEREPEPLRARQPTTPAVVEHVIARCLTKDPDERWQSARDVLGELQWIGQSTTAEPTAAVPRISVRIDHARGPVAGSRRPHRIRRRGIVASRPAGRRAGDAVRHRGGRRLMTLSPDGRYIATHKTDPMDVHASRCVR